MSNVAASPLTEAFSRRAAAGQATLIPYVTAGFANADDTARLLLGLADVGADIIELGIPFSDPMADGPTIQASSFDALDAGMTTQAALDLLRTFRTQRDTPVVIFSYLNPILSFGVDRFLEQAVSAGADGLLLTDLPVDGDPTLETLIDDSDLDLIRLVAPTTEVERIDRIAARAQGFLYYISRTGVTGTEQDLRSELASEVGLIRERASVPVAVGFGISSPEQAAQVAAVADGVVVGSALIRAQREGGVDAAVAFVQTLLEGMRPGA